MKIIKTIIIGIALICLCNTTQAQYRATSSNDNYGLMMTLGGVSIMMGGFATRPERFRDNDGIWKVKKFHQQGPRASAIVCGITLTVTGLIASITKN